MKNARKFENEAGRDAAADAPPPPKRFKFAARRPTISGMAASYSTSGAESDLAAYIADIDSFSEDTDPLPYWVARENKYRSIGGWPWTW